MRGKHETDCEHWASQLRFVPSVGLNGWGYAQCDGWRCLVEILVQMSFETMEFATKTYTSPRTVVTVFQEPLLKDCVSSFAEEGSYT